MTANTDRFPTATARLTYVAGRLTGKAYELILPKTRFGVPEFLDYPEMLTYLENAFGERSEPSVPTKAEEPRFQHVLFRVPTPGPGRRDA